MARNLSGHVMMACPPGTRGIKQCVRLGVVDGPQPVSETRTSRPAISTAEVVGFGLGVITTIIGESQGIVLLEAFGTSMAAAAMFSAISRNA